MPDALLFVFKVYFDDNFISPTDFSKEKRRVLSKIKLLIGFPLKSFSPSRCAGVSLHLLLFTEMLMTFLLKTSGSTEDSQSDTLANQWACLILICLSITLKKYLKLFLNLLYYRQLASLSLKPQNRHCYV